MIVASQKRGWKIVWDGKRWLYEDNWESIDKERPCRRCKRMPTKEGYDACLGQIKGVVSACCGHGVSEPILMRSVGSEG